MNQTINLLTGFDAMRLFLEVRWQEEGKRLGDLGNLLSSCERNIVRNAAPLDIAQWYDWLGAALLVQPEYENVKSALQQSKIDWAEFQNATEIASETERKKALNNLREKEALRTWHRVGFQPISTLNAFEAMRVFLAAYWKRGHTPFSDVGETLKDLENFDASFHAGLWRRWDVACEQAQVFSSQWDH